MSEQQPPRFPEKPKKRVTTGWQERREPGLPLPIKPWMPAPFDNADVAALKALRDGTASPEQQRRGLTFIVEYLARTYAPSFDPLNPRNTSFAEGCRHVGNQIVKLLNWRTEINDEQGR